MTIDELLGDLDDLEVPDVWGEAFARSAPTRQEPIDEASAGLAGQKASVATAMVRRPVVAAACVAAVCAVAVGAAVQLRSDGTQQAEVTRDATSSPSGELLESSGLDASPLSDTAGPIVDPGVREIGRPLDLATATITPDTYRPMWIPGQRWFSAWEDPLYGYVRDELQAASAVWGRAGADGSLHVYASARVLGTAAEFGSPAEILANDGECDSSEARIEVGPWTGCATSQYTIVVSDSLFVALVTADDPLAIEERVALLDVVDGQLSATGEDLIVASAEVGEPEFGYFGMRSVLSFSVLSGDPLRYLLPGRYQRLDGMREGWLGENSVVFSTDDVWFRASGPPADDLRRVVDSTQAVHLSDAIAVLRDDRYPLRSRHGGGPGDDPSSRSVLFWYGDDDVHVLVTTTTSPAAVLEAFGSASGNGPPEQRLEVVETDGEVEITWQSGPTTVVSVRSNLPLDASLELAESVELWRLTAVERVYGRLSGPPLGLAPDPEEAPAS